MNGTGKIFVETVPMMQCALQYPIEERVQCHIKLFVEIFFAYRRDVPMSYEGHAYFKWCKRIVRIFGRETLRELALEIWMTLQCTCVFITN